MNGSLLCLWYLTGVFASFMFDVFEKHGMRMLGVFDMLGCFRYAWIFSICLMLSVCSVFSICRNFQYVEIFDMSKFSICWSFRYTYSICLVFSIFWCAAVVFKTVNSVRIIWYFRNAQRLLNCWSVCYLLDFYRKFRRVNHHISSYWDWLVLRLSTHWWVEPAMASVVSYG